VPNREAVFEFLQRKGKIEAAKLNDVENIKQYFNDKDLHH